jgi:hypothetical protein
MQMNSCGHKISKAPPPAKLSNTTLTGVALTLLFAISGYNLRWPFGGVANVLHFQYFLDLEYSQNCLSMMLPY